MNERIIKTITADKFVKFDGWVAAEIKNINPVFQAAIKHPNHGVIASHCKLYRTSNGERGVINEIIGYLFAHALNIPQPTTAFLAQIPRKHIPLNKLGKEHWVNQQNDTNIIAFCTASLRGKSAAMSYNTDDPEQQQKIFDDLGKWDFCGHTIALDENIAHVDRHLNNLIRLGKSSYAVIDNGLLACQNDYNWQTDDLNADQLFINKLATITEYVNDTQAGIVKGKAISAGETHGALCPRVLYEMHHWINCLLSDAEGKAFEQFLLQRTEKTPWLLRQRYQQVI